MTVRGLLLSDCQLSIDMLPRVRYNKSIMKSDGEALI